MKRVCLAVVAWLSLTAAASAQIMNGNQVPEEPSQPVSPGDLSPYFWIGAQTITVLGKNFQTGASGMSWNSNQSWVSFDVSFLDSHWDTPKKIVSTDDPNTWSVFFKLLDPTLRLNNYSSSPGEQNFPSWSFGVQGFGWKFGTFYENNQPLDVNVGGDTRNVPASGTLFGANEVVYLGQASALYVKPGTSGGSSLEGYDYLDPTKDTIVQVGYPVTGAVYASYEQTDYYKLAATVGSSQASTGPGDSGYAGVLNFQLTPMGPGSYDEPLTYTVKGDLIAGKGFTTGQGNPIGFGVQGQVDYYWDDDMAISPIGAFDGRVNDTWTPGISLNANAYRFDWKAGGGFLVTLSPQQWVPDLYEELPQTQASFENIENAKIRKFTYIQVMADYARNSYSDTARDLNLTFKAEEPDGIVGLDDNLGAMVELRSLNLLRSNPGSTTVWASIGRLDYDLVQHTVTPYVQAYYDSTRLAQLRFGVQMELIKGTALEITYMTSNLTGASVAPADSGRLEIIFGLSTDPAFRMIKTMNFAYDGAVEP